MNRRPAAPRRDVFVLSGGGARGAGQVGMLQVLLDAGITPAALVGCSVGSLNAAFLAADPTAAQAADLAAKWALVDTHDIFGGSMLTKAGNLLRRRPYLYSPDGLRHLIRTWLPADRIEDLATPLRVVTTSLSTGTAVYHRTGPLTDTLLASAALPALFPPVALPRPDTGTTDLHVDGGITDLVPIAGAHGLGTHLWVLDVTVPPLTDHLRNPLDVLVAALSVSTRSHGPGTPDPGVTVTHIRADPAEFRGSLTDFSHTRELIAQGRDAALGALEALQRPDPEPVGRAGWRHLFRRAAA